MVIPVGPPLGQQHLTVVERAADGWVNTRQLFPVCFGVQFWPPRLGWSIMAVNATTAAP